MIPFYDKHGPEYVHRTIGVDVTHLYSLFQPYLDASDVSNILDVGFGSGRDLRYYNSIGYTTIGVDTSPYMCRHARDTTESEIYQCDLFNFSKKVDAIWCCACLVHVPDFTSAIQHFKTLTGGPILISVKIGEQSEQRIEGERTFYILSPHDVRDCIVNSGFIIHEWEVNTSAIDTKDTWLTIVMTPE